VERLRGNTALSAALTGITAAVVGVIANLAVFFAIHTLFAGTTHLEWGPISVNLPDVSTLRPEALAITLVAGLLLFRLNWSVLRTLGACAALGIASTLLSLN
jgi:chromate transporter